MKEVAIIGAGISGLVAAKYIQECGMIPVVLEKQNDLGGLWHPITGAMWFSLRTNISRFSCMFSDFPWKPGSELNPNQKEMFEYIKSYVAYFKLEQYIQFKTRVTNVKSVGERWQIEYKKDDKSEQRIFDFVIVASGIFSKPNIPKIPGMENFNGEIIHSSAYKSPHNFENKNVLVIGGANSGAEISVNLVNVANKVVNLISYTLWVLDREIPSHPSGRLLPVDFVFYKRNTRNKPGEIIFKTPEDFKKSNKFLSSFCAYSNNQKNPYYRDPQSGNPTQVIVADRYVDNIQRGDIILKQSTIQKINGNTVTFSDGSAQQIDAMILCTGYKTDLSFLDKTTLDILNYQPDDLFLPLLLHKLTFHPQLRNMGFVGMYRGPFMGVMELQARWISLIFSKQKPLPSVATMEEGIRQEKENREQKPRPQFPHGDYVGLIDDLAREIDVYPSPEKLTGVYSALKNFITHGLVFPPVFQLLGAYAHPEIAHQEIKKAEQVLHGESWNRKALRYGAQAIVLGLGIYTCSRLIKSGFQPIQERGSLVPKF
jgi:dimethylaniline monooxygenase (N-oxide forming)